MKETIDAVSKDGVVGRLALCVAHNTFLLRFEPNQKRSTNQQLAFSNLRTIKLKATLILQRV
jgi:hypothetical protein